MKNEKNWIRLIVYHYVEKALHRRAESFFMGLTLCDQPSLFPPKGNTLCLFPSLEDFFKAHVSFMKAFLGFL